MVKARARLYVAIAVLDEQRSIMSELAAAGAVSPKTAVAPQTANMTREFDLKWLVYFIKQGLVGYTDDGRIWWNRSQTGSSFTFGARSTTTEELT